MQLHFNLYIASRALLYVVDKTKIRSKTYGINFVVATNHATIWATSDYLA